MAAYWKIAYFYDEQGEPDFTKLIIVRINRDYLFVKDRLDSYVWASRNDYETEDIAIRNARRLAKENNLVYIPDRFTPEDCYLD